MLKNVAHVAAESLKAAILGPHVSAVAGHQSFHCSFQVIQEPPVLIPAEYWHKVLLLSLVRTKETELHRKTYNILLTY